MSFNPNNILGAPARVFLSCTVPNTGSPPNLVAHTNGVPIDGTEIGYTSGPVEFTYQGKKLEINPEQTYMAIDAMPVDEMAQVMFTAYEKTFITLSRAFDSGMGTLVGSTSIQGGGSNTVDLYYFGNSTALVSPTLQSVFFSTPQRRNAGKYGIGMVYRAYSMTAVKLAFTKTKPVEYQVTMKALADATRTAGDQAGQLYFEH